jgi:hypothetical protein
MPEMKGLVLKSFTPAEFRAYLRKEVAPKMKAWRPRGVVLHNTYLPTAQQWPTDGKGRPISAVQRIRNMSVSWVASKFRGGPHLVVEPNGMIWAVWPLWLPGTHSPSWNATFWGMELVGDYSKETMSQALHDSAVTACAALYEMLGREPDDATFKLHREDPRTTHKGCPGQNVGSKARWIADIQKATVFANPGELVHAA